MHQKIIHNEVDVRSHIFKQMNNRNGIHASQWVVTNENARVWRLRNMILSLKIQLKIHMLNGAFTKRILVIVFMLDHKIIDLILMDDLLYPTNNKSGKPLKQLL